MIRKYIIEADDSIKGFDEEIARLEREWGAEEIEPCEDCISRQAVLDKKELVELEDGQSFYCINPKDVETLPSVTPHQTKWIPVSERLPEEGEDVLVCVKGYDSCGHYEDQLWRAPDGSLHISGECKHGECDECKWNLATHFFYCEVAAHYNESPSSFPDGWSIIDEGDEVIAWMPLPKPYEEQSETVQLHDPLIDEVVKSGAPFKKWLESFNTESASVCFNKIQELKGIVGAGSEKKIPRGSMMDI